MAQQMVCDGCEQMPAILLITNIDNGQVLAFCPPCSGIWAQAHYEAMSEAFRGNDPDTDSQADSGQQEAGNDTPATAGDGTEADAGGSLDGADTGTTDTAGGGNDSGNLRTRSDGAQGAGAQGAGAPGPDDAGADPAGRHEGSGGDQRADDGAGDSDRSADQLSPSGL